MIPNPAEFYPNLISMRKLPFERFITRESSLSMFRLAGPLRIHLEDVRDRRNIT
jgi:hypothetical protein